MQPRSASPALPRRTGAMPWQPRPAPKTLHATPTSWLSGEPPWACPTRTTNLGTRTSFISAPSLR